METQVLWMPLDLLTKRLKSLCDKFIHWDLFIFFQHNLAEKFVFLRMG